MTDAQVSVKSDAVPSRWAGAGPATCDRQAERSPYRPSGERGDEAQVTRPRDGVADPDWIRSQRVTALMATYNRGHYIQEALDSLLQQTRPPDEIIVVDDGSTDDTPARVQSYGDRVRYIAQPNSGKAAAINRGLRHATGDWLWCFDDDDVALPGGLEQLLAALAAQRDADFAYGGQMTGRDGDDGRVLAERVVLPPDVPGDELFSRSLRNIPFLCQGALIRRARFAALGGFDERYTRSVDYEFLLRLLQHARGVRVGAPVFVWRSHDGPRGPQHARHDVSLRERVWMEVGGDLGRDLRRRLPLAAYLPPSARSSALGVRDLRRALIQRMSVMASKGLVREMLVDLHSAATLVPDVQSAPLDDDEARACRDIAGFPFFRMRLLDAPDRLVARLLVAGEGPTGRAVLAAIARGVFHAARHAEVAPPQRSTLARCALRLFRGAGAAMTVRTYFAAGIE